MGIELCRSCIYYEEAGSADLVPYIYGYCSKAEWPFTIAIFKEEREGAFCPPNWCEWRREKKKSYT